ncbi:fimbria/pilus periplasmic chaperone, partial [Vibrio parahaemolyticus]|uniref:fimbria/pilus periplasmic chaperone n=1 Tax=Vibrio parahaemolyticus TaxID=670 RepID=UPI001A8C2E58
WLDTGDASETPDTIKTPFQITPPISRIDAKGGQTLRIRLMDKNGLPQDKESLWWLNILDIPPTVRTAGKEDQNFLQLA